MIQIGILLAIVLVLVVVLLYYIFRMIYVPRQLGAVEKMIQGGQYQSALKALKMMAQKKSNQSINSKLHALMADCYKATGNNSMAVVEYKTALRDTSSEPLKFETGNRSKLAESLLNLGKKEEALSEYLLLLKLTPNNADGYYKVGKIYYDAGAYDKSSSFFIKALQINDKLSDAYYYIGLGKFHLNQENDALDFLVKSLKFDPKNSSTHYYLGKIYRNMRDYVKALEEFEIAMRDNEFKPQSLLERGLCFIEMGSHGKAIIELERGLTVKNPSEKILLATRYSLAACYEVQRELLPAVEQWEAISRVKPTYRDVQTKLATYGELRHDDALKDFLTAGSEKYEAIARKLMFVLGLKTLEFRFDRNGDVIILAQELDNPKMVSSSLLTRLVRIRRETDKIQEDQVRALLDKSKDQKVARAVFVSAAKFSDQALRYCESRPIDLIDSTSLQELLKKAQDVKEEDMRVDQIASSENGK